MRTHADIRVYSKNDKPKYIPSNEELVQVMYTAFFGASPHFYPIVDAIYNSFLLVLLLCILVKVHALH